MTLLLTYLGFFFAGLAGSLHCIGMCGPILTALSGVDRRAEVTVDGRSIARTARRAAADLLWYHAGRLCTYAMLGALAGAVGERIRKTLWLGALQDWLGVSLGAVAIVVALALFIKPATGCAGVFDTRDDRGPLAGILAFLRALARQSSRSSRFLLGAIMGFIPCGLVYIMLAAVATTGHPLAAALGMIAFGLGTLPALTGVVIAMRFIPIRWRRHGNRMAMLTALVVGAMFLWRSWPVQEHADGALDERTCPLCDEASPPQLSPSRP